MSYTRRFALSSAVLIASSVAAPAHATTFDDVTVEELARASDLVIVGTVEQVTVHAQGPGGQPGIHTRAIVRVEETWRGQPREIVEVWVHGGRLGDRMRVVPGQATFRAGERVVLFLFEAGGGVWPTGMGRGKWLVDRATYVSPALPDAQPTVRSIAELRATIGAVR